MIIDFTNRNIQPIDMCLSMSLNSTSNIFNTIFSCQNNYMKAFFSVWETKLIAVSRETTSCRTVNNVSDGMIYMSEVINIILHQFAPKSQFYMFLQALNHLTRHFQISKSRHTFLSEYRVCTCSSYSHNTWNGKLLLLLCGKKIYFV